MLQREKIEELMAQAQKDYLLGSPQTALRNDLEALRLAKNLGEPHMLARAHIELSRCYRWLHKPNLAMEHIHEALGLFHEFEDETLLNLARFVHGRVLVQLGLSDEAYVEMSKVAKWAKTNRDLEMYVRAQDWMAIVFVLASNFEKAAALFEEIQGFQDTHQFENLKSIIPLHRGFFHTRYADHMMEQGDEQAHRDNFEIAMMWTRQAIDAAFEIGDSWYQFTSLCNAAECAAVLEQFDEAEALLVRAEALPKSLMDIGAVHFLYTKSEVANRRGDHKTAIEAGLQALDFAKENPDADNVMNAQRRLAEAYESAALFEEALTAHKAYHALYKKSLARRAYWQDRLAQYKANVKKMRHQLERANVQVAEMTAAAYKDALTGLGNRRAFDASLRELEKEHSGGFAIAILDIDHFKRVNDNYSHLVGDDVLRHVADIMEEGVRGKDKVLRIGGEEFAILLPKTNLDNAVRVCERIRQHVESWDWPSIAGDLKVSISCGVALASEAETVHDAYALADARLLKAKSNGRNRTEFKSAS